MFWIAVGVFGIFLLVVIWILFVTALPPADEETEVVKIPANHPNPLLYALRGLIMGSVGGFVDRSDAVPPVPRGQEVELRTNTAPGTLQTYAQLCGFDVHSEDMPLTFPQVRRTPSPQRSVVCDVYQRMLAVISVQVVGDVLGIVALTHSSWPLPTIPFPVHFKQQITCFRPIKKTDELTLRGYPSRVQKGAKGIEVDFTVSVLANGHFAMDTVLTALYRFKPEKRKGAEEREGVARPDPPEAERVEEWSLPEDLGRRYAAVSGDYNPIHLYGWMARLFGFKGAIIHGLWTLARCVATMQENGELVLPPLAQDETTFVHGLRVSCEFKRPVVLPRGVQFRFYREPQETDHAEPQERVMHSFAVYSADLQELHLSGHVSAVPPVLLSDIPIR